MVLLVDKHRPASLGALSVHNELTERLRAMSRDGEIPHLLFYGPSGAGKKTRIMALLREIFGPGAHKLRLEHRSFKTPTNRQIDVTTIASTYHIEMSPGDAGIYDRYVVQEVIKEIASSQSLTATMGASENSVGMDDDDDLGAPAAAATLELSGISTGGARKAGFKVVVLMGVDRLTKQAQAGLRRTMEKYTSACRLILCCNSTSKVIEPVRSRCLGVRVPAPSEAEVCGVLHDICRKENLSLPDALAARVAKLSNRNLRRAILMLEACKVHQYPFTVDQPVQMTDWENYIGVLAVDILKEQGPASLLNARAKLYELLTNCIPADVILRALVRELGRPLDDTLRHELAHWAAFYEHRLHRGSKEIFHLEAFIARFMQVYKSHLLSMYS